MWFFLFERPHTRAAHRKADLGSYVQRIFELADMMGLIQTHFKPLYGIDTEDLDFAMDIEFKITENGQLAIKQARPWMTYRKPTAPR